MSDKIIVGPINQGTRTDRTAFVIDNDSFPTLINAYQWRGRIKRKRGTSLLGRATRYFNSTSTSYSASATITLTSGSANLLTGFSLQASGNIVPGSVNIVDTTATVTYTDNSLGALVGGSGGSINYSTGAITITGGGSDTINATFLYYPGLPIMGLEDLVLSTQEFPGTLAFDTKYSYNILTTAPYSIYDVSFYKNPPSSGSYTHKTTVTPTSWNGQNYQQFWTVNYQGALWATNGITVPFTTTNIGMQFAPSSTITFTSQTATTITLVITNCPLVIGDFVFLNEWGSSSVANSATLNFQSGYVTAQSGTFASNTVTITLPNATLATDTYTPGIVQYLTNRSSNTVDCLRWYDGDPTNGNPNPPTLNGNNGWVNFAPPLSQAASWSINNIPAGQYYLVGARMILPFKDRLLFFGPVVQTSAANSQVYLPDTIIYSQNGTPYYTASFTGLINNSGTVFYPILVPTEETATPNAYFEDTAGFGGFTAIGLSDPITTVSANEDVLILGFTNKQVRLIYSGNDLLPFNFYIINSEFGSSSTFSSVSLDRGVLSVGPNGILMTNQVSSQRIDLQIPDAIFEFSLQNNGRERVCAQRDFINEWVYFTYLSNEDDANNYLFPNQTLQYNYRDDSWATFDECYTTYGTFRQVTGNTWATIGNRYSTWSAWTDPWNAGQSTLLQPMVIGGNQQGFILFRAIGTDEGDSLSITSISGLTVTSPNHCLNQDDFIVISGCIGTITPINGVIFQVQNPTQNTFVLGIAPGQTDPSGTYVGGGVIKRMYVPDIQTKQFPTAWDMARKTRIGAQQYLFTTTSNGQITLLIFLSQNGANAYNEGVIVPDKNSSNNSLVYSSVLYTCPEYAINYANNASIGNVGDGSLTTITLNLFSLLSFNTPIIAGSVYFNIGSGTATFQDNESGGFTVTGTGVVSGSSINYGTGEAVLVFTAAPNALPSKVSLSYYYPSIQSPTAQQQSQTWHRLSTSLLGDTVQIGFTLSYDQMIDSNFNNQFAEIELHSFILAVSPSQLLA